MGHRSREGADVGGGVKVVAGFCRKTAGRTIFLTGAGCN